MFLDENVLILVKIHNASLKRFELDKTLIRSQYLVWKFFKTRGEKGYLGLTWLAGHQNLLMDSEWLSEM